MKIEKENPPIVSVIICVYNRKGLITRALDSLQNQTFQDFETIFIDDGSTDGTSEIIFNYIKKNPRSKYIRRSNRNLSYSKNTGILISQGTYITFLDSDDEYKKEHLDQMVKFMDRNPECDFIHSSPEIIGNSEDMWLIDARDTSKLINVKDCVVGPTFFGRKEVFVKLSGFKDVAYAEDFDFFNRLIDSKLFKVKKLDEKTYIYYKSIEDSLTNVAKRLFRNNLISNDLNNLKKLKA